MFYMLTGIVEKLKKDLQALKQNLQKDTVQAEKNGIIGSAALEQKKKKRTRKQNLKVDAILPKENDDNIGLADLKQRKKKSQAKKHKASDWIKVGMCWSK